MANKRISELTVATQPLTLSDVLPIVQSSGSRKVAVKDLSKVGYQDIITDATTTRQFTLADVGCWIRSTSASAIIDTIPANATVPFPIGQMLNGIQAAAGQITFTPAGGVTVNKPAGYNAKTRAQGSAFCLIKIATDVWDLVGDLEATV